MTSTLAPQAKRYQLTQISSETWQVIDTGTGKALNGPDETPFMDQRDAHDLHQEYIWS